MTDDADKALQCFTSIHPACSKGGELVVVPGQLHQPKGPRLEQGLGNSEPDGEGHVLNVISIRGFPWTLQCKTRPFIFHFTLCCSPGRAVHPFVACFGGCPDLSGFVQESAMLVRYSCSFMVFWGSLWTLLLAMRSCCPAPGCASAGVNQNPSVFYLCGAF